MVAQLLAFHTEVSETRKSRLSECHHIIYDVADSDKPKRSRCSAVGLAYQGV